MQPDPSSSTRGGAGSVTGLWRYPVKSMLGEELNAAEVTERGLVGDRQFAVIDRETGKVAGAARRTRASGATSSTFARLMQRPREQAPRRRPSG
jgi:uncharacterized protein YcbX